MRDTLSFIGFGEAAGAIAGGWGDAAGIRAYDVKTDAPDTAPGMWSRYRAAGVQGCATVSEAVAGARAVFSTVTADQAVNAAGSCAPHMEKDAFFFDLNSCAPASKRRSAELIEAAGARYVDVAVMAPVYPKRNMVPLLVAGPHARAAQEFLAALPMAPRVVEGPVGAASSIKMIRSVMIKGMEALTAECILAARAAGVDAAVLASLQGSNPEIDWPRQAAYNFERAMVHGIRRAAEMREVAKTLTDLGLPDDMARATVEWEDRIGQLRLAASEDADYAALADTLLPRIRHGA